MSVSQSSWVGLAPSAHGSSAVQSFSVPFPRPSSEPSTPLELETSADFAKANRAFAVTLTGCSRQLLGLLRGCLAAHRIYHCRPGRVQDGRARRTYSGRSHHAVVGRCAVGPAHPIIPFEGDGTGRRAQPGASSRRSTSSPSRDL